MLAHQNPEKPVVVSLVTHLIPAWISYYLTMVASVTLIEGPGYASPLRVLRPRIKGVGFPHLLLTQGVEVLRLNLRNSSGRGAFEELLSRASVLILGISPNLQKRLGLEAGKMANSYTFWL